MAAQGDGQQARRSPIPRQTGFVTRAVMHSWFIG